MEKWAKLAGKPTPKLLKILKMKPDVSEESMLIAIESPLFEKRKIKTAFFSVEATA